MSARNTRSQQSRTPVPAWGMQQSLQLLQELNSAKDPLLYQTRQADIDKMATWLRSLAEDAPGPSSALVTQLFSSATFVLQHVCEDSRLLPIHSPLLDIMGSLAEAIKRFVKDHGQGAEALQRLFRHDECEGEPW